MDKMTYLNRDEKNDKKYKIVYPNRFGGGKAVLYSPSIKDMQDFLQYCVSRGLTPISFSSNPDYKSKVRK